jgi:hypothetical protein
VDFNGRTYRVAAQLVSFLEERMHGPALHQANEEKEFCHASARGQPNQRLAGARPEVPNWLAGGLPLRREELETTRNPKYTAEPAR